MKALWKQFKGLTLGAKLRLILQLLAYVNQGLIVLGSLPLAQSMGYQVVSLIVTILITAVTYWYNNDWTGLAKLSTKIFDVLKDGKVTEDEVEEFLKDHAKS
jgi:SPP1 family holin